MLLPLNFDGGFISLFVAAVRNLFIGLLEDDPVLERRQEYKCCACLPDSLATLETYTQSPLQSA